MKLHHILLSITATLVPFHGNAKPIRWTGGSDIAYSVQKAYSPVVDKALQLFSADMQKQEGKVVSRVASGNIMLYQLDMASNKDMKALGSMRVPILGFITKRDAYWIGVRKGKVIIVGSNGRGTAYGLMQLASMSNEIDDKYEDTQVPSVEFRGISMENTNLSLSDCCRLFELMLRMRANTFCYGWDAGEINLRMTKELRTLADSFGIDLATPHDGNSLRLHGHKKDALTVDITWHDDGYGYVMPTDGKTNSDEGGCVYHLSYGGRPHSYLWLSTTQPGLIANEMQTAYRHGAKRLWMAALHDPNVAAYQLGLFMDMAWNIDTVRIGNVQTHLKAWLEKKFGGSAADKLLAPMSQYYRLVGIRRPEFMDFSRQTVPSKTNKNGDGGVRNTEFNAEEFGNELERYLNDYREVCRQVEAARGLIDDGFADAYFTAVEYPVRSAALMADKILQAQESRLIGRKPSFHHDDEALESAARSMKAYWAMQSLTRQYNDVVSRLLWSKPIDASPRGLAVFGKPQLTDTVSVAEVEKYYNATPVYATLSDDGCIVRNAFEYTVASKDIKRLDMTGHSLKAVELQKGDSLTYRFRTGVVGGVMRLAFVPTFSPDGGSSQCSVSIDGNSPITIIINDGSASSDRWAQGVLRGQSLITLPVSLSSGLHTLVIKSLNDHVVFDQWMIDKDTDRQFYMFPVSSR